MDQLQQPTKHAATVARLATAAFAPFLSEILNAKIEAVLERGRSVLISRVEASGLSELTDPQVEFFLPAAYQFMERVKAGEYEFHLNVLADIIAGNLASKTTSLDCGAVGRAARALAFMTKAELQAATFTHIALSSKLPEEFEGKKQPIVQQVDVLEVYREKMQDISEADLGNYLKELSLRGLIYDLAGRSQFGGYTASSVLAEIMMAAGERLKSETNGL